MPLMATSMTGKRGTDSGDGVRQRAVQSRTLVTRGKIVEGAVQVLAEAGVEGLTHRAVAEAAGVSLAATTYHFETKSHIIEETSRVLLADYLAAFRRMADRISRGESGSPRHLDGLVERVVHNSLGRDRIRSLAWSELVLHGGRTSEGRVLAQRWYDELDLIWNEIAALIEPGVSKQRVSAAIDMVVGLMFVLHPLDLQASVVTAILAGRKDTDAVLARRARVPASSVEPSADRPARHTETREKVVEAAIDLIVNEGVGSVSYRRVAEAIGMVRSGPSYYFQSIDEIVASAQTALFERARSRYRAGLGSTDAAAIDRHRLLDLTTAIFYREALEFGRENIGHYSVWMRAAQHAGLRPAVASSVLSFHRAWSRRIAVINGTAADEATAVRMQALFIGKLIRTIVASTEVADLSRAREDFADALKIRKPAAPSKMVQM